MRVRYAGVVRAARWWTGFCRCAGNMRVVWGFSVFPVSVCVWMVWTGRFGGGVVGLERVMYG